VAGFLAKLKTDFRLVRTHKQLGNFLLLLAVLSASFIWANRENVRAIAWHCTHGNFADVGGGRRVRLPLLWWKGDGGPLFHAIPLNRACNSCGVLRPEISVSRATPGEVMSSNEDQLRSIQRLAALRNQTSSDPARSTLVTIKSPAFVIFCDREESISAITNLLQSDLVCEVANFPYSFSFWGDPRFEKEAESILSTLQ
jgi:hypothetical protein